MADLDNKKTSTSIKSWAVSAVARACSISRFLVSPKARQLNSISFRQGCWGRGELAFSRRHITLSWTDQEDTLWIHIESWFRCERWINFEQRKYINLQERKYVFFSNDSHNHRGLTSMTQVQLQYQSFGKTTIGLRQRRSQHCLLPSPPSTVLSGATACQVSPYLGSNPIPPFTKSLHTHSMYSCCTILQFFASWRCHRTKHSQHPLSSCQVCILD